MAAADRQFEALVKAYSADLYRYAHWLCRQQAAAEDLVQETFMRAWRALDTLQDSKAAKGWLFTILRREHARACSRVRLDEQSLEDFDLDRMTGAVAGNLSADTLAVRDALASLPIEYREPLVLQVLGGYSCSEIAQVLGLKPGAVMTRLFRARQKLRNLLHGDESTVSEGRTA